MEHLLNDAEVGDFGENIPEIRWLGFDHDETRKYEIAKSSQYPLLRGWTNEQLEQLKSGSLPHSNVTSCLAMLQSWLSFGFLESAFLHRFPSAAFVMKTSEATIMNTSVLRPFLDHRRASLAELDREDLAVYWTALTKTLDFVQSWYIILEEHYHWNKFPALCNSPEFHPLMRMVVLLGETIASTVSFFPPDPRIAGWIWPYTAVNEEDLARRMQRRGWCSSMYSLLGNKSYGYSFLEYASILDPTDPVERHKECLQADHKCRANNIDTSSYSVTHATNGCNCGFFQPSLAEVCRILEKGKIPLIDADVPSYSTSSRTSPAVIEWDQNMEYTAISHVWIDGLGSDTETGLPLCQLEVLRGHAQWAGESSLLWIDSLCIPQDPAFRKAAIRMMAKTYKSAARTIIIDAGLRSRKALGHSNAEVLLRILSSSWIQRLWTLQEFLLSSRSIWIVYQDHPRDLALAYESFTETAVTPTEIAGVVELEKYLTGTSSVSIGALQHMLQFRNSSKTDDESLAIAPLLQIDVSELLELTGPERMARFWRLVGHVPSNIVFLNSPKLEERGLCWAPRSLMSINSGIQMNLNVSDATITEAGLRGTFFIYSFSKREPVDQSPGLILDSENQHFVAFAFEASDGPLKDGCYCDALLINWNPRTEPIRLATGVTLLKEESSGTDVPRYQNPGFNLVQAKICTPFQLSRIFALPSTQTVDFSRYRYHRRCIVQFYEKHPKMFLAERPGDDPHKWPLINSRLEKREILVR